MSSSDEQIQGAEALKAEANALHMQGQHRAAYIKYSEAIKLNGSNAILFANRAATSMAMKEYLDAGCDAYKATQIDPNYTKAWARLAKASHEVWQYEMSIDAWNRALSCLDRSDLSDSDIKLKRQCEEGLGLATLAVKDTKVETAEDLNLTTIPEEVVSSGRLPWQRALDMENELQRSRMYQSSAWVIMNAYRDFSEGVRTMKLTKRYDDRIEGNLNAITDISNGILRDERVFHMDTSDWLIRLNTQSEFEGNVLGGWARGGVKIVQEEAAERLKSHGWGAVRSALSVTIRAWLMSGYLSHKNDSSQERALQLLNSAVSVLEWGASLWRNIPKEERGVIFEKTFVRGVKRLRIEAYMKACKNAGPTSSYNVEELMTMARDMIDDVDANPPTEFSKYDPGYVLSFWQYPKAGALAALGFCQMKRAVILKNDETEENHVEIARSYFAEAAHSYMTAAETYPEDDELHVYFLKIAFETFWHRGLPLRESLPLCALIRGGVPKARKIWGYSVFSRTLNKHIDQVLRFQRDAMRGLLVGEYTMDTPSSSIAFT